MVTRSSAVRHAKLEARLSVARECGSGVISTGVGRPTSTGRLMMRSEPRLPPAAPGGGSAGLRSGNVAGDPGEPDVGLPRWRPARLGRDLGPQQGDRHDAPESPPPRDGSSRRRSGWLKGNEPRRRGEAADLGGAPGARADGACPKLSGVLSALVRGLVVRRDRGHLESVVGPGAFAEPSHQAEAPRLAGGRTSFVPGRKAARKNAGSV